MKNDDAKLTVSASYDSVADDYLRLFGVSSVRQKKLEEFIERLSPEASVLDLGCGAGVPVAKTLTEQNFVQEDMGSLNFAPDTFDGVCAFYSVTHVPSDEHRALVGRVAEWLRPGGIFIASLGASSGDWSGTWLGVPMFFSHNDPKEAEQIIRDAGLVLELAEFVKQDNEATSFLWITARKPSRP
jgi:cyclopropane fatty-acyl-phospholipid synthase-like methyltransferase